MDISAKLDQVNADLKSARIPIKVEQQGSKLRLRATLPPKPGDKKHSKPHQQRIALGLPANLAGLRTAFKEAKFVGTQLANRSFEWSRYIGDTSPENRPCVDWIKEFHRHYIHVVGGQETTWQGDYDKMLRRLPQDQPLTAEQLKELILTTKPNTKSRIRACMVAGAIAKFAELKFDPKPFRGNYSPSKVTPRDLPDDKAVATYRNTITNPVAVQAICEREASPAMRRQLLKLRNSQKLA